MNEKFKKSKPNVLSLLNVASESLLIGNETTIAGCIFFFALRTFFCFCVDDTLLSSTPCWCSSWASIFFPYDAIVNCSFIGSGDAICCGSDAVAATTDCSNLADLFYFNYVQY